MSSLLYRQVTIMTPIDDFERLKADRRNAYEQKKCAHSAMNDAEFLLTEAVDGAHMAYRAMRHASTAKWEARGVYDATKEANRQPIEALDHKIDEAYQNAGRAYQLSHQAYLAHDHVTARAQAAERRRFVEAKRELSTERTGLVVAIQTARIAYEETDRLYYSAVAAFKAAKTACEPLVFAFQKAECAYRSACEAFDAADEAVQERITAESIASEKALVVRAGVPSEHVDRTWVRYPPDGKKHLYFGGDHVPDGPGHAHYVVQPDGSTVYARDPSSPRGPHNFTVVAEAEEESA